MSQVTLIPTGRQQLRAAIAMRATDADDAAADLRTAMFTLRDLDHYHSQFIRAFYALYLATSPHIENEQGHKTICETVGAALDDPTTPVLDIRDGGSLRFGLLSLFRDYKRHLVSSNLLQVGTVEDDGEELFDDV